MCEPSSCDIARKRDYVYRLLTCAGSSELSLCASQVRDRVSAHTGCHPSLQRLVTSELGSSELVLRAMVLFAMHVDDDFMQWLLDHPETCRVSLSMFRHDYLQKHATQLLDGNVSLDDFVSYATVDYICC